MVFEDSVAVPGRVNLIGEHIDYHGLPVLPMAIGRRIRIAFRARADRRICAASAGGYGERDFEWTPHLECGAAGDWANYLKAAAQAVGERWHPARGIDAQIESDLPPAAGLSSSSALLTGFTLALLRANHIHAAFEELMEVLPEAEHFVGTRGGGMDHAVVLAAKRGCALLVRFAPVSVCPVPVPRGWAFLVAHSLEMAEKSGAVRAEYNARRTAGARAIELQARGARLEGEERRAFEHITGEAKRVEDAVDALRSGDAEAFGRLLDESHASLRDNLGVSTPALDALVEAARAAGALGARLTGAGFGGCAIVFCRAAERGRVRAALIEKYYSRRSGFDPAVHLIDAEPSAGALGD